ncbi:SulP family inorganic anion transporter [Citricoccus sp.]|uniref:SulP family inorganic anion transporter n=1 Tax=Citricoccus sp. TaxID=1978372 RepID=UPI002606C1FB|nr:SulP family inorganic anion transporter [Citricoccus sp.]HRO29803.1 SulP family inorganic anion transporter [Citricoccus sp.]HRO94125.1 SulP family inorganic anion transporter [Citricoccus sp.]
MARAPGQRPGRVPIIGQLRTYDRAWLRGDLIAGVTVAALIVPKNLGYAGIAGIPLQNGLYAAAAGALVYGIFGSCRQISMGPSSGLAAVAASAVLAAGITGEVDTASFVAGITLASGLVFLVLAVLRIGWIAQFLSKAVVTGFLCGAAIDVVIGELPKLTGTDVTGSNPLQELRSWVGTLGEAHPTTVVVGGLALAVVFGLKAVVPRVPGALVLVVGGLLAAAVLDLGARGVALVGDVPRGLPSLQAPDVRLMGDHAGTTAIAAVALVLIGFSQTAGDARTFAARHHYQININQESLAQSLANMAAGLFRGMPVSTSLSASSLNDHSGAKTGLASLTSGATVLLTLLILAPLFSILPKPVLAALIIEAVVMGMMDVPEMRRLARVQKVDFWIAVAAIFATVLVGVLAGVLIGIGLSLIWLIAVATHPAMPVLGREPGTRVFREADEHPGDEVLADVAVLRLDGGLFFATADALEDRLREIIHESPGLTGIVLDCGGINFVDSQGSAKMADIVALTHDAGVILRLTRLRPAARGVLDRDGVIEAIGADRIHGNIHRAVEAQRAAARRDRDGGTG